MHEQNEGEFVLDIRIEGGKLAVYSPKAGNLGNPIKKGGKRMMVRMTREVEERDFPVVMSGGEVEICTKKTSTKVVIESA